MKIIQHYEDPINSQIIFDITIETKTLQLHSTMTDLDLDVKADIKQVLKSTSELIGQMIRENMKR